MSSRRHSFASSCLALRAGVPCAARLPIDIAKVCAASTFCSPRRGTDEDVTHLFAIRASEREALRTRLAQNRVETAVHYPLPDYRQPAYMQSRSPQAMALPMTDVACSEVITLPCYPGLMAEQVDRVIATIREHFTAAPVGETTTATYCVP